MKAPRSRKQACNQGSVLVISLTILAIGAIVLASYLVLVQTQTNSVARSQVWNTAIAMAEAGVEEGMAEINKGLPSGMGNAQWNWTNNIQADGWSQITSVGGTNQTSRTRSISGSNAGSNSYTVTISYSGTNGPTITSSGTVAFTSVLWGSYGAPPPFLAQAGNSTATNVIIGRKVQVNTSLAPLFGVGILTRSNFNMNGNNTVVDSFDSTSTNYSTGGQWDVSKRKANGSIATDSGVVGDVSLGNGNIYGHVYTGPGSSQNAIQVGSQGSVGDLAWQSGGNSGIESNYWAGNFNMDIPAVVAPTYVGAALPTATNGSITLLSGNNYTANTDPGSPLVVSGPNPTVLWVKGNFSPSTITFTNGGSLVLYLGTTTGSGDSLNISGNGTLNGGGLAANLQIFGLPSLTGITVSGNGALVAAVYAPEASFTGNGGGTAGDSVGSLVVNSVTLHGHFNFHYDESLANSGPSRAWVAGNWAEQKYP